MSGIGIWGTRDPSRRKRLFQNKKEGLSAFKSRVYMAAAKADESMGRDEAVSVSRAKGPCYKRHTLGPLSL